MLVLAALVVWAVVLFKAINAFSPSGSKNNVSFNSDSAIVVLMANDDRPITVFNFYYYCADRWGAWQFVLAQGIRRATGYTWTPHGVLVMQAAWVLLGAWAFAGLCRRDWAVAGLAYLVAACLHREGRLMLFELSQIYGWQITGLVFAWLGIRRMFDRALAPPVAARAMAGWVLFTIVFGLLAIWSSVASIPMLAVLCVVEAVRAWARSRSGANGSAGSVGRGTVGTVEAFSARWRSEVACRLRPWASRRWGSARSRTGITAGPSRTTGRTSRHTSPSTTAICWTASGINCATSPACRGGRSTRCRCWPWSCSRRLGSSRSSPGARPARSRRRRAGGRYRDGRARRLRDRRAQFHARGARRSRAPERLRQPLPDADQHVRTDRRHLDAVPGDPLAGPRARFGACVQPVFALAGVVRARDGIPARGRDTPLSHPRADGAKARGKGAARRAARRLLGDLRVHRAAAARTRDDAGDMGRLLAHAMDVGIRSAPRAR